jgi:hypothetical protein
MPTPAQPTHHRDALVALRRFVDATHDQYVNNLRPSRKPSGFGKAEPRAQITKLDASKIAAAQSFDAFGGGFIVLGSLIDFPRSTISYGATNHFIWLVGDAQRFDYGWQGSDQLRSNAVKAGEQVICRATFISCMLDSYIRANAANTARRVHEGDASIAGAVAQFVERSQTEFARRMGAVLPTLSLRDEMAAFAKSLVFPVFPVSVSCRLDDSAKLNDVLLPKKMHAHLMSLIASAQAEAITDSKIKAARDGA